jgi:predicted enzyme related to lactoylglutathione lyase
VSERSEYKLGEFCWVDLATTDIDAAKKFYGELIGWDWEAAGDPGETGGYGFFTFKGKQVCGGAPVQAAGQPSAWSSYVNVADADESAGKVKGAGGTVLAPPFELPNESGRMAVCQDAEGAFFSLTQQRKHKGAELVNEIGAWTWNNLVTRDLDGAKRFYGDVFGWSIEKASDEAGAEPFFMWQVEGQKWEEGLAGAMLAGEDIPPEVPPHWQVYFCVESATKTIDQVNAAGGQTLFGPQRIPVGELAVFSDPQGAGFAIIEPDYPEQR